ncbi:MAG: hypothetical protein FJ395_18820, partial [Verrucomicrobia bacterium]|nr:hypothetical protein [Verrucomicrobiota bacterium]
MNDRFEEKLQSQQFRQVPSSWRREIVGRLCESAMSQDAASQKRPTTAWRDWLWPSPVAWGAVAAAWVLIGLLQLATPQPRGNGNGGHLSGEAFQQRQLL